MKTLSLKLDDSVFSDTEQIISHINKSRNRYINEALDFYNKVQKRKLLAARLEKESKLVKDESIKVLHEFEMIDYESEAI
jgi:predicted transcriptional regulator